MFRQTETSRRRRGTKASHLEAQSLRADRLDALDSDLTSTARIRPQDLELAVSATPRVSIIVPAFNELEMTKRCVQSITRIPDTTSYELILIDDCSTDPEMSELGLIDDLTYLRNTENLGFLRSCNRGAEEARGEYLLFLNNDTVVQPGWLDTLLETFEYWPDAGLVGSKLIYPDGVLQEAGSIIWSDGSGYNCGRFGNPEDPRFNYVREVDYCSGASIQIKKAIFDDLGGFDDRFAPAYYEDVDLAFQVRRMGKKVYYQPHSQVIHYEGVSSGTDTSAGVKRFQARNRVRFIDKWKTDLERDALPPSSQLIALDPLDALRILVVDDKIPTPDRDAGSLRMQTILTLLRGMNHAVTIYPRDQQCRPQYMVDLQKRGIECVYPLMDHRGRFRQALGYLRKLAMSAIGAPSTPFQEFIASRGSTFDLVILSRVFNAEEFTRDLRRALPDAKLVFDTVDLHYLRAQRKFDLTQDLRDARDGRKMKRRELGCAREADATLVVSPFEKELLLREEPDLDVQIISTIHEVEPESAGPAGRSGIIFIGGFEHPPNVDSVLHFVGEILPLVHAEMPNIQFRIVGGDMPEEILALASDTVHILGHVPDATGLWSETRLSIAPIRYGAGVKGKISQSMAYGVPVVTTSIGAEGMALENGENALIADEPSNFASAVLLLLRDDARWTRVSRAGTQLVKARFSPEVAQAQLEKLIDRLGVERLGP